MQSNKLVDKWQIKFLKLWDQIILGNRIDVIAIEVFHYEYKWYWEF